MHRCSRLLTAGLLVALACPALAAGQEGDVVKSSKRSHRNIYLVRMAEDPVVTYGGGIAGIPATRPDRGQKINPNSPNVIRYVAYLDDRHAQALAGAGGGRKLYDYRYAVNGFAAELSAAQAARIAAVPGVISVEADVLDPVDTVSTPRFLGLTAPGGLWEQLGGVGSAGEGIIIGMLDTGIWPEHPSVSDRTRSNSNGVEGKLAYQQIPGWHGRCVPGESFTASDCNQKLIGCQFFGEAFGTDNLDPTEYLSCRDSDSHGTHTSTTAGGNANVPASIQGIFLGMASGIAPRARIATYKVCWREPGVQALCSGADRAAAIDQAVHDGVDVLSHSIGSTTTNFLDSVMVAFLNAASAGVFVASAAGNSGPTASTVASPGPWLTTVAASTHDRLYVSQAVLGDGSIQPGVSLMGGTGPALWPLVYSSAVGLAGKDATEVRLCFSGTLDPAKVAGKIVLCDRGTNARVDKSLAVQMAGGVGMILRNLSPTESRNADIHYVPSLHVDSTVGATIKNYIDTAGAAATARLEDSTIGTTAAPFIASFSSRGPSRAVGGDILKPDLTAPGVDVLAGISPAANAGKMFDFYNGTSMATPHVAGLAALLKQRHPDWSPMMIKSALMTTATQVLGSGSAASPFAQGAGHVAPNKAVDPGLVYDADFGDWLAFICGTGQLVASYCPGIAIDPSDMNVASIAIGDLPGIQTVKRTVTNVGPAGTYTVSVTAPPGFTVSVNPSSLNLATGGSATYEATITRDVAALNSYQFGSLTWSDGTRAARSPIVVRPVALAAPASLSLTGASGSTAYSVKFGYTGPFAANPHGLVPAVTTAGTVADDPADNFDTAHPADNQGISVHTLVVPAGMVLARIALFDEFTDGVDDIDLYVYNSAGTLVASSSGGTSAEQVNIANPAADTYTIYVHGWATDGPDAQYTLFTWTVGAATGNLSVTAPAAAVTATSGNITLDWSGLAAATKYLGVVRYLDGATERGRTTVAVDVP